MGLGVLSGWRAFWRTSIDPVEVSRRRIDIGVWRGQDAEHGWHMRMHMVHGMGRGYRGRLQSKGSARERASNCRKYSLRAAWNAWNEQETCTQRERIQGRKNREKRGVDAGRAGKIKRERSDEV